MLLSTECFGKERGDKPIITTTLTATVAFDAAVVVFPAEPCTTPLAMLGLTSMLPPPRAPFVSELGRAPALVNEGRESAAAEKEVANVFREVEGVVVIVTVGCGGRV